MLIGCTDEQDLMALQTAEARVNIGRQHRPRQIAKVLDAIDVGKCRSNEITSHNFDVGDLSAPSKAWTAQAPDKPQQKNRAGLAGPRLGIVRTLEA
jgi:hypothetical protein